jgi:hypothetical protein
MGDWVAVTLIRCWHYSNKVGQMNQGLIWTIVGILLIVALIIWISRVL